MKLLTKQKNTISNYLKALDWVRHNTVEEQGIIYSSNHKISYLEVTGYLIPTLMDCGEFDLAFQYAEFLSYMQRPNGSFCGPDGSECIFDSGQVLRGLLRAAKQWEQFTPFARKTADYLCLKVENNGRLSGTYDEDTPEAVHVFALQGLIEAAEFFNDSSYMQKAKQTVNYYKNIPNVVDENLLSHFLMYIIDGFIEMGEVSFVEPFVQKLIARQNKDGGLPAYPQENWICSVGTAQFAIVCYKLKHYQAADLAMEYVHTLQNPSGGFYGSYGRGRNYFVKEEISWANKFYLDAYHMKIKASFDRSTKILPPNIPNDDGRLSVITEYIKKNNPKKILDAGCGKGRFALKIREMFPEVEIHGVDVSVELLNMAPDSIIKKNGSVLNLPYEDETFDMVYCVEVLEHALQTQKALDELCRVLKPDGEVLVIDKNIEKLGELEIEDFEQWFDKDQIKKLLGRNCYNVRDQEVSYDDHEADGLFFAWSGTKGLNVLSSEQWHAVMVEGKSAEELAEKIKSNNFPVWIKPLLQHTSAGDSFLELGSGTGELSAILAQYERKASLLDYSQESIDYAKALFKAMELSGEFYCADIFKGMPLEDNCLDWVFSSGVLEHYTDGQITQILKDSFRVCKKGCMSLVPNSQSLFYRIGKLKMETEDKWEYGREIPKQSMKHYFESAGFKNIKESSVGTYYSLKFWGLEKKEIKDYLDSLNNKELRDINQGYLLFTYGEKNA